MSDEIEFVNNCSGKKWQAQLALVEKSISALSDQVSFLSEAAHSFEFSELCFFLNREENPATDLPEGDFGEAYKKAAAQCQRVKIRRYDYSPQRNRPERHLIVCFSKKAARIIAKRHCWAIERATTFLVNDGSESDWQYWRDASDSGETNEQRRISTTSN